MTATKPQFEPREYVMEDGRTVRPLVKQLTRCIGIRRSDETKRSPYVLICIDTGLTFGSEFSRQDDCLCVARSIQEIVDDFRYMASMSQAIESNSHRQAMGKILKSAYESERSRKNRSN